MIFDDRTPFRAKLYLRLADLIVYVARGAVRRRLISASNLVPALHAANALARAAMRAWRASHASTVRAGQHRRLTKRSLHG